MSGNGAPFMHSPVRAVDAKDVVSHAGFRELCRDMDQPLLLKGAALAKRSGEFTVKALSAELGGVLLPDRARARVKGAGLPSGCAFTVADQGEEDVIGAKPVVWDPSGKTFGELAEAILAGSGLYLSTRSGKAACARTAEGDAVTFAPPGADHNDVLVRELAPRAPVPLLLPPDVKFQMVFWVGSKGKNFGLHTDLFCEQFLVQHEGVKEVSLLLPEDASAVQPFPFISSPLFYKSQLRTVLNADSRKVRCLRAELHPGDVLYIPPWWWHEVQTISPGVSLSSTCRFHTEDDARLNTAISALFQLHKNAQARSESLGRHVRSYFAHGLTAVEADASRGDTASGASVSRAVLLCGIIGGAALGFIAGRRQQV